jgi:hypothetical protein
MAKPILSFEEYAANKKLASTDTITETDDDKVLGISDEDSESEEHEKIEGEEEEKEEDAEEAESEEEPEESEDKEVLTVSARLIEGYESAIKEACDYDADDYPDHTLESYLKENAALIATLAASTLEQAHAEIKGEEELTIETYDAILNGMKESYNKKIDELKDVWSAK